MLEDKYLPIADVSKVESVEINAPIDKIYPLVEELDFSKSKINYWLFKLRGIPVPESLSLKGLEKIGFVKLETIPDKEIILGLIGQFWTPTGKMKAFQPAEFASFNDLSFAKATWNFEITPISDSRARLSTETRIFCPSETAKRKFKFYWTLIQPFSSFTRHEILKIIKRKAEGSL